MAINYWLRRCLERFGDEDGPIMIAPDEDSESTPDLKGRCFVLVHERYERPIYAMLDPGETVEDLKRDVETVRPGCRVMLPAPGGLNK